MTNPEELNLIPSLPEVTDSYLDILAHNSEHTGFGALFGGILKATVEQNEVLADDVNDTTATAPSEYIDISEKLNQQTSEGDMDAELKDIFHGDIFMRIGIKIAPFGNNLEDGSGKKVASTELVPLIENTELFVDFLSHQTTDEIEKNNDNLKLMSDVLSTLQKTIVECFRRPEDETNQELSESLQRHGEDALRTFLALDEQYIKLGLDMPQVYKTYLDQEGSQVTNVDWRNRRDAQMHLRAYGELLNYVKYWGQDVLPEYIEFGSLDRMTEPNQWAMDGMQDKFEDLISRMMGLVGPERTTNFGIEVAKAMQVGIEKTIAEMDANPDDWRNHQPGGREFYNRNLQRLKSVTT